MSSYWRHILLSRTQALEGSSTLVLGLSSSLTLGRLVSSSMPHFCHVESGNNSKTYLTGSLERLSDKIHVIYNQTALMKVRANLLRNERIFKKANYKTFIIFCLSYFNNGKIFKFYVFSYHMDTSFEN